MARKPIVTIDGPSGAGKSTVSRALAARLCFTYLDTGALYRAVAYAARRQGIAADDEPALAELCGRLALTLMPAPGGQRILLQGEDVTDAIRTEEISLLASRVSALPAVRRALLTMQRRAAAGGGVIAEGRDTGTIVFPDAEFKFFLDADLRLSLIHI